MTHSAEFRALTVFVFCCCRWQAGVWHDIEKHMQLDKRKECHLFTTNSVRDTVTGCIQPISRHGMPPGLSPIREREWGEGRGRGVCMFF